MRIPFIRVERLSYEVFEGTSGFYAHYLITDLINGAQCHVRGPGMSGCTWHGDVVAMPWPNPVTAFNYAQRFYERTN